MKSKVSYAVAAILGGVSLRALAAQPAPASGAAGAASQALAAPAHTSTGPAYQSLREIIVTATRHRENVQSVPITMQVLTAKALRQLHISSFQDMVTMVPNLTSADNGPGQNEIVIRGISTGYQATQFSGFTAP